MADLPVRVCKVSGPGSRGVGLMIDGELVTVFHAQYADALAEALEVVAAWAREPGAILTDFDPAGPAN